MVGRRSAPPAREPGKQQEPICDPRVQRGMLKADARAARVVCAGLRKADARSACTDARCVITGLPPTVAVEGRTVRGRYAEPSRSHADVPVRVRRRYDDELPAEPRLRQTDVEGYRAGVEGRYIARRDREERQADERPQLHVAERVQRLHRPIVEGQVPLGGQRVRHRRRLPQWWRPRRPHDTSMAGKHGKGGAVGGR